MRIPVRKSYSGTEINFCLLGKSLTVSPTFLAVLRKKSTLMSADPGKQDKKTVQLVFAVQDRPCTFITMIPSRLKVSDFLDIAIAHVNSTTLPCYLPVKGAWLKGKLIDVNTDISNLKIGEKDIIFLMHGTEPPTDDFVAAVRKSRELKQKSTEPIAKSPTATLSRGSRAPIRGQAVKEQGQAKASVRDQLRAISAPTGASKAKPQKPEPKSEPKPEPEPEPKVEEGQPGETFTVEEEGEDMSALLLTTVMVDRSDLGMKTKEIVRDKTMGWTVYSSLDYDSMISGTPIDLDMNDNVDVVKTKVRGVLKNKIRDDLVKIQLYFVCGIEFNNGTLGDCLTYIAAFQTAPRRIYAVVTRDIPDEALCAEYGEMCDIRGDRKLLLSPVCDSTDGGLSQVACLLGYLHREGKLTDSFLRTVAVFTGFAPLIVGVYRLSERAKLTGKDIVAVTAPLFAFCKALVQGVGGDNHVFEFTLRVACYAVHGLNADLRECDLPVMKAKWLDNYDKADTFRKYCEKSGQRPVLYLWIDWPVQWKVHQQNREDGRAIETAFQTMASFRPVEPNLLRFVHGCTIVSGPNGQILLYLGPSESTDEKKLDIIDPQEGVVRSRKASKIRGTNVQNAQAGPIILEKDDVGQLIEVCVDASESMKYNLAGEHLRNPGQEKKEKGDRSNDIERDLRPEGLRRKHIAYSMLTLLADRLYGFRIPSLQGLITFSEEVTEVLKLSPILPEFEEAVLTLKTAKHTHLWDAINLAADNLINACFDTSTNPRKRRYPNARMRILVVSDGDDKGSKKPVWELAEKLVTSRIIVDSIVLNAEEKNRECRMLAALSHITDGISLRPQSHEECLEFVQTESFLMLDYRKTGPQFKGPFTQEKMKELEEAAEFDKSVPTRLVQTGKEAFATPRSIVSKNQVKSRSVEARRKRILRELYIAGITQQEGAKVRRRDGRMGLLTDPNLRIFTKKGFLDQWRVYLKGPPDTPYDKWWYLQVAFPKSYPYSPPSVRFVSVPYHVNVSSEGRICLRVLDVEYRPSMSIVEILHHVRDLLREPDLRSPTNIQTLRVYTREPEKYLENARKSTSEFAKDSAEAWIGSTYIQSEEPVDFKLDPEEAPETLKANAPCTDE